jgi:magnesium transporter
MSSSEVVLDREQILDLIARQNYAGLRESLYKLHPADIAELFRDLSLEAQVACFETLESTLGSYVLQSLDEHVLLPLTETLDADKLVPLLEKLPSDEAADILNHLEDHVVRDVISRMPDLKQAANLRELLSYPDSSAGGLMSSEFIKIYKDMTAEDTLSYIRVKAEKRTVNFYYLYVVDRQDHLVGVVGLRTIITSPPYMMIEHIMTPEVISVNHYDDEEAVATKVQKYQLLALPVVDNNGRLKGIVTWDDASYVINRELAEDYFISSGISTADDNAYEGALLAGNLLKAVRSRTPWLLVTMIGSLFAVGVGNTFHATIEAIPTLAIFMPLLGGLGGNVGTQSSAMIVRGLAIGQVDAKKPFLYILNQSLTGLLIGAIFGLTVGGLVYLWQANPWFGIIIGVGLFANITLGATLGTFVPILLKRLNMDPAIASGPFISTAIDITGLTIYFGFATLALQQLHGHG